MALVEDKKISCKDIKLEITERVLMDDQADEIRSALMRLRGKGIGISLDDFGTGYASLVHLQTLPVDEIKIDRSFVTGLGTSSNRGEIVQAMIGLAKAMRLVTVAEGIETQGEALKLAAWGCELGQGYLFCRPMSFDEATRYLRRGQALARRRIQVASGSPSQSNAQR